MNDNQGRTGPRASLSKIVTTLKRYAGGYDQTCAAEVTPLAERAEQIASLERDRDKVRRLVIRGAIERGNVLYLPGGRTPPAA